MVGGAAYDEARQASEARAAETGALLVHAYDQPEVLAGQGTVAAEFEADAPELTHLLVAVGGGGLIGGIAAWHAGRGSTVVSVEPEGCPALFDALRAGRPVPAPVGGVAADSLGARQVGALAFAVARQHVAASVLVPDAAIRAAQRALWERGARGGGAGRGDGAGGAAVRRLAGAGGRTGGRGGLRRQLRSGKRRLGPCSGA